MLDKFRGMNLISWFPCIIAFRVSLPFDEVLESFRSSELSVCNNSFDFVFLFSVNDVIDLTNEGSSSDDEEL